jgi:hypothetical protein
VAGGEKLVGRVSGTRGGLVSEGSSSSGSEMHRSESTSQRRKLAVKVLQKCHCILKG